eukprot:CAMPEP_0183452972 /NCGR_PEP_ID=MMETSP0370-20130417/119657_1 /TAXON_ID=268820 /ORGANISM="Peridinium aciculiferum, Strain PAER-2" /LENGTH=56 /DNA_ID=CAMNT_0025644315 /DNA_START=43 /DNA_END=209 /DNA_ORIENTATION=+
MAAVTWVLWPVQSRRKTTFPQHGVLRARQGWRKNTLPQHGVLLARKSWRVVSTNKG